MDSIQALTAPGAPPPFPFPGGAKRGALMPLTPDTAGVLPPGDLADLTDEQYLDIFKRFKKECFADRHIWESQWTRNIHYINLRQWLAPWTRQHGWRDLRTAKKIPRPVTSLPKEGVMSIRAMFTTVKLGVTARPAGQDPKAITTAAACDDMAPVLHDLHEMNAVMNEFDYWFIGTGNAMLHTWWDSTAGEIVEVPYEQCLGCELELTSVQIADNKNKCPQCNGIQFVPAVDENGEPRTELQPQGAACTTPLSLLEVAFPLTYARWKDVPGLIRMRWRDKRYFEEHPDLKALVPSIAWSKEPTDRSLQIFQSLPYQNDMPRVMTSGGTGESSEGIAEYEMWLRPTPEHPHGLVLRVIGDAHPIVLHMPSESLPGPLPYTDAKGNPLFTFAHAGYEHVGGRVIASGALDPVMSKFDQLNRLESIQEMIMTRMASPNVVVAKGSGIQWSLESPGLPGLVVEWDPGLVGDAGKPEFHPGVSPSPSFQKRIDALKKEIEEGMGTFDVVRGAKPAGVEAFSALQLLVERGQARFANAFMARAEAYKQWYGWALELERAYGPNSRVKAVMSPTRSWAFREFKKADLTGDVTIVVEDGSTTPKTQLGQRASIQHLNELGMVNPQDGDQKFAIYEAFGQQKLAPGLNAHVQMALRKQEKFEKWILSGQFRTLPQAPRPDDPQQVSPDLMSPLYPLKWHRWYDAQVHRQEFLKWCNSDRAADLFLKVPEAENFAAAHLVEMGLAISQKMQGDLDPAGLAAMPPVPAQGVAAGMQPHPGAAPSPGAAGAAQAMGNSNQNSAPVGNTAQPAMAGLSVQ